jgi:glucokinase
MLSVLGVDLGGTKIAVGPVDREGVQLASPITALTQSTDATSLLAGLGSTLRRALSEFECFAPGAVGLACAGTVDGERGEVITSPHLPLRDAPLAAMLQVAVGVPVVIENDGNAAVLGEVAAGAAIGLRHVVMLTLGTGVGSGLFLDGRLYRGANGAAGEIGHMVVQAGGLACRCGQRGCLEMYASGPALARYAGARARDPERDPDGALLALRETGELHGAAVTHLAREGHPGALEAVKQLADWLGIGMANITNTFDPEMIVVGGGVSDLGEMLLGPARESVRKNAMPPGHDRVRIEVAKLGNRAGLVGGALVAWQAFGSAG